MKLSVTLQRATLLTTAVHLEPDVFVISQTLKWESLSLVKQPSNGTFSWKLENFSTLNGYYYSSQVSAVEQIKWYVSIVGCSFIFFCKD